MTNPPVTEEAVERAWPDWEITERELMEAANASVFRDRPDLQFKFDGSAPPLIPPIEAEPPAMSAKDNGQ